LSALQPRDEFHDPGEYDRMTPEEREHLAFRLMDEGQARMVSLGALYYSMKKNGDNLDRVRQRFGGMVEVLIRIGAGQVLPAVYRKFGAKSYLYRAVSRLDLEDQRRLAEGDARVAVLTYGPHTGEPTERMLDPCELTGEGVKLVFAPDHIRNLAEQAAMLDDKERKRHKPQPETAGKFRLDRVMRTARCGNYVFTLDELKLAVKLLSD
jgi:hypothetical protein